MAEEDAPRSARDGQHPVLTGLIALVAVAVAVGLVLGGGALLATQVLGLDGDEGPTTETTAKQSMYLPEPRKTEADSGPLITLAPDPDGPISQFSSDPSKKKKKDEDTISLSADESSVGSMEQINLRGVYPGGEGSVLQVQQFEGGAWGEFPVFATVTNETFATFIQTGQPGLNRFRVIDTDTGEVSNEIRVTIT